MTGWTPSTDGGEIIRVQPEPSFPPFPVQPGIQHHANPPTCPVESCPYLPVPCPYLPLCHARVSPCVMPVSLPVSCPCLPLCHARVSPCVMPAPGCHARLPCVMPASRVSCLPPGCHARLPFVIPAKAGIQSLFPIRHVLVRGATGGRASLALPFAKRRECAGVRVKERSSSLSCDTVGFLLPSAPHILKTLRMSETLWVVGVAQG